MLTSLDDALRQVFHPLQPRLENSPGRCCTQPHVEHLVEIAVKQASIPADLEHGTAHQSVHGGRIVRINKLLHIALKIARTNQEIEETADRSIGAQVKV